MHCFIFSRPRSGLHRKKSKLKVEYVYGDKCFKYKIIGRQIRTPFYSPYIKTPAQNIVWNLPTNGEKSIDKRAIFKIKTVLKSTLS